MQAVKTHRLVSLKPSRNPDLLRRLHAHAPREPFWKGCRSCCSFTLQLRYHFPASSGALLSVLRMMV